LIFNFTFLNIIDTTNDIAFISSSSNKIFYYTGNCEFIGCVNKIEPSDKNNNNIEMKSLCFSNSNEGNSVNVIAVGLSNGLVYLYSTWDLTLMRIISINLDNSIGSIISLVYTRDCKRLFVLDSNSRIYVLESSNSSNTQQAMSSILIQDYE
jgi:hypothetical protein